MTETKQAYPLMFKEQSKDIESYDLTPRKKQNRIKELAKHLNEVFAAGDLQTPLTITVEWTRSRTWGSNPQAFDNFGRESSRISGCGYDKHSTAVAQVLNKNLQVLKVLYDRKERELRNPKKEYREQNGFVEKSQRAINQFCFGYGSGYDVLPHFEGGVGVTCFQSIFEKLKLKWSDISSTKHTDVHQVNA